MCLKYVLALAAVCCCVRANETKPPNVLILLADDVGMGDLGCFGNTTLPTPNIDRLANEGVKLTQHLATSAVCTPSRASLMTGRYAIRMGMTPINRFRVNMFVSATGGLPPEEITFAELLKTKNYSTAFIGKWHLGMHGSNEQDFAKSPLNQGFDYFYGLPLTNLKDFSDGGESVLLTANAYAEQVCWTLIAGSVLFVAVARQRRWMSVCSSTALVLPVALAAFAFWVTWMNLGLLSGMVMRNEQVVEQPVQLRTITQRLVHEGETFLRQRADDRRPFLLYMSWLQVHTALHASEEFRGRSAHGAYGDEVLMLDWTVGQLLNALEHHGFADNTIVYFSSDQGGHTEERGLKGRVEGGHNGVFRGGKAMGGWEGGIRVPTLMRWRDVIPAATQLDVATSQMDLLPTLASATGVRLPDDRHIDGTDLMPLLRRKSSATGTAGAEGADAAISSVPHEFLFHYCGTSLHAARWTPTDGSGNIWKAHFVTPNWLPGTERCHYVCQCYGIDVTVHDAEPLLFNLATDPGERRQCTARAPCAGEDYASVIAVIRAEAERFQASLQPGVEHQYAWYNFWPRPWLQPCCNFPYCSCKEEDH